MAKMSKVTVDFLNYFITSQIQISGLYIAERLGNTRQVSSLRKLCSQGRDEPSQKVAQQWDGEATAVNLGGASQFQIFKLA
jgi:hypothetical protein